MDLGLFLSPGSDAPLLWGRHDPWLVALSLLLAVGSGVLSMHTAHQARTATGRDRRWLLLGGGVALGGGVWAMHFVGMLAFDLCLPVRFRLDVTLLSLVPSLLAATLALHLLSGPAVRARQLALGSVLVGLGIGAMHYTGMAAMEMAPALRFDPYVFVLSLLVVVPLATLALWVRFGLSRQRPGWGGWRGNLIAGTVMGLAISAMHYTGMAAARFVGDPALQVGRGDTVLIPALGLALVVLLLSGAVMGLNAHIVGRRLGLALHDAQRRYRALLDNLPGQLLQLDAQLPWTVRMANQRVRELSGHAIDSLLERPFLDTALAPINEADRHRLAQALAEAGRGQEVLALEFESRLAQGQACTLQLHARPSREGPGGQVTQIDLLLQDVTEHKARERELQLSRALILGSSEAIVGKSLDGIIQSWNPGATELFGYSAAEVIGRHITLLFRPFEVEQEVGLMARVRQGKTVPQFEAVRLHKNGHEVEVSVTLSPIVDEAGRVVGASKIAHGIGDRKANEALRQAKERAEQMAATRSAFLATMSHELRTPMNAVMGFTSVLLETPLNTEQRSHVLTVQSAARALLRLLNDILDTARLEKGALALEDSPYDLHELLAELARSHGAAAAAKGLTLERNDPGTLPQAVRGDRMRVSQLLGNLLDNAIKFTPQGQVGLRAWVAGGQLSFEVSDTGLGMDAAQVARLFEAFTQGDASMSRRFGGTGLGTAICQQLTRLMGGDIAVRSQPGQGSTFTVRLPLRLADPADTVPAAGAPALPTLHVLVAGDVPELPGLLGRQHEVKGVSDVAQLLLRVQTQAFDVILMDTQAPTWSGLDATRRLREAERVAGRVPMPVIGLQSEWTPSDEAAALSAGLNGVLTRPLNGVLMKQEIARVLGLAPEAAAGPQAVASFDGVPLVDERLGVEIWGGMREVWVEGLVMFAEQLPAHHQQIRDALAAADPTAAVAPVHALRGTASTLGLQALSQLLEVIETALRRGEPALALSRATELDRVLERTVVALAPLLKEQHTADAVAADAPLLAAEAMAQIDAVVATLQRGEIPGHVLDRLKAVLGHGLNQAAWGRAATALDNFEFDRAVLALTELRQWVAAQPT